MARVAGGGLDADLHDLTLAGRGGQRQRGRLLFLFYDCNLCSVVPKSHISMYLPGDNLVMGIPFPGPLPEKVTKLLELILNKVGSHRIFVKRSGVLQVNSILAALCHNHHNNQLSIYFAVDESSIVLIQTKVWIMYLPRLSALFAGTAVKTLTQTTSLNYNPTYEQTFNN